MKISKGFLVMAPLLGLTVVAGCASVPTEPSVMALPGTGKSYEQFRYDDADCRSYAKARTGDPAGETGLRSAAVGTTVGAVAGAAIGGRQGAGVGAGTGLIVGSVAGAGAANSSTYGSQRYYDNVYVQCMYAKGHKVPVSGSLMQAPASQPGVQRAPASVPPPPPPGNPPPPPPGG